MVGDLVEVKGGDRIPADIRIIASHGCKVIMTFSRSQFLTLPDKCGDIFTLHFYGIDAM